MPDDPSMNEVRQARDEHAGELLADPRVHSVGIGFKVDPSTGLPTDEPALVVLLNAPDPEDSPDLPPLPTKVTIVSRFSGTTVDVDVEAVTAPPPTPLSCDGPVPGSAPGGTVAEHRPAPGGVSLFQKDKAMAGTLGGWVWDNKGDRIVLLTNHHVLYHEPDTGQDLVVQPAMEDKSDATAIALRDRASKSLDAAIAVPLDPDHIATEILGMGPAVFMTGSVTWESSVEVVKVGRTTGMSKGKTWAGEFVGELPDHVFAILGECHMAGGFWPFKSISPTAFSHDGDSGSLVLESQTYAGSDIRRALGLLYGAGNLPREENGGYKFYPVSYARQIEVIFEKLDLSPICSGFVPWFLDLLVTSVTQLRFGAERAFPERFPEDRQFFSDLPEPVHRGRFGGGEGTRRFLRGFAAAFERRISESLVGSQFSGLLRRHRAEVVEILRDQDGWRAVAAALAPFLAGAITSEQVLSHRITQGDIERIHFAIETASSIALGIEPLTRFVEHLCDNAAGRTLRQLIFE